MSQDVLKSTRIQLERELALEDISSVKDLPAYNLLRRWVSLDNIFHLSLL